MLYFIGLGLADEKDITVRSADGCSGPEASTTEFTRSSGCASTPHANYGHRGLEVVKACQRVYLEAYTSVLLVPKERLVRIAHMPLMRFHGSTLCLYVGVIDLG